MLGEPLSCARYVFGPTPKSREKTVVDSFRRFTKSILWHILFNGNSRKEAKKMQFDRETVDKLLSLNDFQLKIVVTRLLKENGIDPSVLNIDTKNMAMLRQTLQNATEADIERAAQLFSKLKGGR